MSGELLIAVAMLIVLGPVLWRLIRPTWAALTETDEDRMDRVMGKGWRPSPPDEP